MSETRDPGDAPALSPQESPVRGVDRGDRPHAFEGAGITVTWSRRRCIHVAACVMNLPDVFQPGQRPWIDTASGSTDAIARVVSRCPTGALHYERTDGGPPEAVPAANTALLARHGPIYLFGDIEVMDETGALRLADTRVALCRCGRSATRPLCDGTHLTSGFRDAGEVSEGAIDDSGAESGALRIRPEPNGPLQLEGPFALASADRQTIVAGSAARLCRCGQSQNKPFCDGSHQRVGFVSG